MSYKITNKSIELEIMGSVSITDAVREACLLSIQEKAIVYFDFNEIPVSVNMKPVIDKICQDWNNARY